MKFWRYLRYIITVVFIGLLLFLYIRFGLSRENDVPIDTTQYEAQKAENDWAIGNKWGKIVRNWLFFLFDAQPVDTQPQATPEISTENGLLVVTLQYVVDGDTVIVEDAENNEFKVRMIGIDTAESVHEDETRNNIYGKYASDYTKQLLSSTTTLYLEFDKEAEDKYGRTLAYVWTVDSTEDINNMLNYIIIRDGYANTLEIKPNVKYSDYFSSTCKQAMSNDAGLWQYDEFDALWD